MCMNGNGASARWLDRVGFLPCLILLIGVMQVGCYKPPPPLFSPEFLEGIQRGKTTKKEIVQRFGVPTVLVRYSDHQINREAEMFKRVPFEYAQDYFLCKDYPKAGEGEVIYIFTDLTILLPKVKDMVLQKPDLALRYAVREITVWIDWNSGVVKDYKYEEKR